jgi:hypothetical protein
VTPPQLIKLALFVHLAAMCSFSAFSQVIIEHIDRVAPVSARAAALGDAYVAEATDASNLFGNPAALSFLRMGSLFVSHSIERKDWMMSENLAFAFPLGEMSACGLGVSLAHTGYIKDSPRARTKMRVLQYAFAPGYSQRITRSLGIGANVGLRYVESEGFRLRELSPAIGLFYAPSPEISYGLAYCDQGSLLQHTDDISSTNWRKEDPRRILQIGLVLHLKLWRKDPVVTLSLANAKVLTVKGLTYKGGIELRPIQCLAIRTAYFLTPSVMYTKLGAGFYVGPLRIDYAVSPSQLSDRLHEISAVLTF